MKFLCVSDVHDEVQALEFLREFAQEEKPDAIVFCGDLTHRGPVSFAQEFLQTAKELRLPVFGVHGNMDPVAVQDFLEMQKVSIHCRKKIFKGQAFAGFGGSNPTPHHTECEYSEEEIAQKLESMGALNGLQTILISHTPPFGTKADDLGNGLHIGSKSLRAFVEKNNFAALVCGHAHQNEGVEKIGETLIVKVAPLMQGKAALLELPLFKAKFLKAKRVF